MSPRPIALLAAALVLGAVAVPVSAGGSPGRPSAAGAAAFVNYPAPGQLAREAGEPSLGANPKTGRVLYQAFTETDQITFDDAVFPATAAWKDVSRPPTSLVSLDPILDTDEVTGRTLISQLAPPCSVAAFTDSDGEPTATSPTGYLPSAACGVGSNFDHQTVHFGRSVTPNPLYGPNRLVWYCSQVVVESTCSVSRDGGITFPTGRPAYTFKGDLVTSSKSVVGCEGLHGHLNSSPKDGTAYLPNFGCNSPSDLQRDRPSVVVSPDEGLTWTIRQVPDGTSPNFDSDPAVDVDAAGRAYFAYENATSNLMVATTTDRGATFSRSVDLGAPYRIRNAVMPTVVAGSAGRAAVAFLGTVAEAPLNKAGQPENQQGSFDPDGSDPRAGWHLYLALTYDGGSRWTTYDLTPDDPVQRGCIFWGAAVQPVGPACGSNKRNLLDFIDIAMDGRGRVLVGWADGCVGRCVTEGQTRDTNVRYAQRDMSRDGDLSQQQFDELYSQVAFGAVSRQSCGLGLLAQFDAAPDGPAATCARFTGRAAPKAPGRSAGAGRPRVEPAPAGPRLAATGAPAAAGAGALLVLAALLVRRRRARS